MESEDDYESDPDAWKFSRPWMRLFEDEENVEIDLARTEQKQSKITSAEGSLPMYDPRFWIVLRFFRTVQGFHQASELPMCPTFLKALNSTVSGLTRSDRSSSSSA